MRLTKEQKGLAVLDVLMDVDRETLRGLISRTEMRRQKVKDGIEWIRDFAPNALVVQRSGGNYYYKIAEDDLEVAEHVAVRSKTLYKMALRLERMTAVSLERWPTSPLLKIMHRHLTRMREDVEDLVV